MPKRAYFLDINEPQKLLITWEGGLHYRQGDMSIFLDGNLIGTIPAHMDLKQGQEFVLLDSSVLSVKLENSKLRVFRSGQDLALIEGLRNNLRYGWFWLIAIGIVDVTGGIFRIVKAESAASMGVLLIACGILFLGLSLWARQRSKIAFILGMALCVIQIPLLVGKEQHDMGSTILGVLTLLDLGGIWIGAIRSINQGELQKKKALEE